MGKQMLTLKLDPKSATLAHVRHKLKVRTKDLDSEFGVISIDPKRNLYAVLLEDRAVDRAAKKAGVRGPFSNPQIEPFGLPKKDK